MPLKSTSDWSVNIGNECVASTRQSTRASAHGCYHTYDNRKLLPYVGQPGWIVEQPEYEDGGEVIDMWYPACMAWAAMYKCLKHDTDMYRVRFNMPDYVDSFRRTIYSNAMVCNQDFEWSHVGLKECVKQSKNSWHIEVFEVDRMHERQGHWVKLKNPDWASWDLYRIVEA